MGGGCCELGFADRLCSTADCIECIGGVSLKSVAAWPSIIGRDRGMLYVPLPPAARIVYVPPPTVLRVLAASLYVPLSPAVANPLCSTAISLKSVAGVYDL